MRLGIDVDEVVADLHTPWIIWGNEKFGTKHTEFKEWPSPQKYWGPGADEFLRPELYADDIVKPIPGALEAIDMLRAKGHEILFVTSCPYRTEAAKWDWLVRHEFAIWPTEMVAMSDKRKAPVNVLVDDNDQHVQDFEGAAAVLVRRSHNRGSLHPYSIGHLCELPEILRRIQTLRDEVGHPK